MIAVLFVLSLVMNILVGLNISYKHGSGKDGPIYDMGFNLLPNLEQYEHLPDYLLIVPALFLLYTWPSWTKLKRNSYLTFLTIMFFARAICNMTTVLPYTKQTPCKIRPGFGYCNDYMFSGHTTFNIITSNFVGSPLWPIWPIFTSLITIATRDHYTIDTLIAWILFFAFKCRIKGI